MVYIIILNYLNYNDTLHCLNSIGLLNGRPKRVLLVDNASNNESVEVLEEYVKSRAYIKLFKSPKNLGYAGGNNIALRYAMKQSDMEYCWILNNDTIVERNSLDMLYDFMKNHSDVGICGSKLIYDWDRSRVQGYGGFYNPILAKATSCIDINKINQIDYVIGASAFVSRKFLEDIGVMCEDYFLYCEEIDWAERARGKYKIACEPKSVVYHKEGASTCGRGNCKKKCSILSDYYQLRSRLLFTKKYYKKYLPIVYITMILAIFNRIKRGQFNRVSMICKLMLGMSDKRIGG